MADQTFQEYQDRIWAERQFPQTIAGLFRKYCDILRQTALGHGTFKPLRQTDVSRVSIRLLYCLEHSRGINPMGAATLNHARYHLEAR